MFLRLVVSSAQPTRHAQSARSHWRYNPRSTKTTGAHARSEWCGIVSELWMIFVGALEMSALVLLVNYNGRILPQDSATGGLGDHAVMPRIRDDQV